MTDISHVAPDVARHLIAAERSQTVATRDQALLLASILDAGHSARLALKLDQRLIEDTMAGLTDQVSSRRRQLDLHNALAAVLIKHGLDPKAFGESGGYAQSGLQVVRSETPGAIAA